MLFLRQLLILPVLCHKSATTFQIDSCKVSNSMLMPDLSSCIKSEMIESAAPSQQPHKQGTFSGHLADKLFLPGKQNSDVMMLWMVFTLGINFIRPITEASKGVFGMMSNC